jgi:hypothetical protein
LFNKVLYQNDSKRDIQHIRPFAQSAHATISSLITQPLQTRNLSISLPIAAVHRDTITVTTWSFKRQKMGELKLKNPRFKEKPEWRGALATCLNLSMCGNFVFIGYSTGHVDKYNIQSGIFRYNSFLLSKFFVFIFRSQHLYNSQRPYAMLKAPVPSITVVKQH